MPPVRNLRGIGSRKPIPIFTWIPPGFNPIHKIEVFDVDTGTAHDVTDLVIEGEYTWGVTGTIGKFEFTVDNSAQDFLNIFTPYDEIRVYLDYGATASTIRFKGLIERVSKKDFNLVLTGRGPAAKFMDKNVTYSATDKARSTILTEIIQKYFTDLTTNNLSTDSITSTVNYFEVPFWTVVEDICNQGSFDAYVDADFDFNYFERGSKSNITEAIIHEYNLIETGDFAPDASNISNSVKVYGKEVEGIPILATAPDTVSQGTFGVKDLKIQDASITTVDQAQSRANYELSLNKDAPVVGSVTSLLLPTIQPGEKVRISDPLNELAPDFYEVFEYRQMFNNDDPPKTEVTIKKERNKISNILKKRIRYESEAVTNVNPNELDHSIIYDYETDVGTHSGTEITEGVLKLKSGETTGIWESDVTNVAFEVSFAEVRREGDDLTGLKIYISLDGGANYSQVEGVVGEQVTVAGQNIKVRVIITSTNTRIRALGILYS